MYFIVTFKYPELINQYDGVGGGGSDISSWSWIRMGGEFLKSGCESCSTETKGPSLLNKKINSN